MKRNTIIKKLNAADITKDDWYVGILESIPSDYQRGYVDAKVSGLTDSLESNGEYFREELVQLVKDIVEP